MNTESPATGTPDGVQLVATAHAVLVAPVHVLLKPVSVAVALNVAGDPASEPLVAVAVCAPGVEPSVQLDVATPLEFVTLDTGDIEAPPLVAQFTVTPETGLPDGSVTVTASGVASGVSVFPLWLCPPVIASVDAEPAAMLNVLVVADVTPLELATSV